MRKITFPFLGEKSDIFGKIGRPVAQVSLWSLKKERWNRVLMIVDTGADYTLLPKYYASILDVDLKKDCRVYRTMGIGGREKVFLFSRMPIKIGTWQGKIPVGFLNRDDIPPLLGREQCLNRMGVLLYKNRTTLILN